MRINLFVEVTAKITSSCYLPDILSEGRFFPEFVLDRDLGSGDL